MLPPPPPPEPESPSQCVHPEVPTSTLTEIKFVPCMFQGHTGEKGGGGTIPLLTIAALSLGIPPVLAQHVSHQVDPKTVKFGGCSPPSDVGNVRQGQGLLPISGAQHAQAFCHSFFVVFVSLCSAPMATKCRQGHSPFLRWTESATFLHTGCTRWWRWGGGAVRALRPTAGP